MKNLPYILFVAVFSLDFLSSELGSLPRAITWVPELLSGLVFLVFVIHIATTKSLCLHPKYVFLFFVFSLILLAGIALNSVGTGAIFIGLRYYLKYIPFFLLPVIFDYSDEDIQKQLKFLLILGLLQFPLVFYQKFVQNNFPDQVTGTLEVSSVLSFYLVSVLSILFAFYLKKKIAFRYFIFISILLFLPTTLNETKGTIFLLPVSLAVILITANVWRENRAAVVVAVSTVALLLVTFFVSYNVLFRKNSDVGLASFFTDPEKGIQLYLYSGKGEEVNPETLLNRKEKVLGQKSAIRPETYQGASNIRRLDALILPIHVLSTEPTKLVLGLGMGNVSRSFFAGLSGEYTDIAMMNNVETSASILMWELGLAGLVAFLLFFYFVYKDSKALSIRNGLVGIFATGWTGIVAMFILSLPYKNFLVFNVIGFLVMYFSGYIAANCWRYRGRREGFV